MTTGSASTTPLAAPKTTGVSPLRSSTGTLIPAIAQLRVFSPEQWEDFVLEWAHSLKSQYARVERCGGAGDLGRDVVAFVTADQKGDWHNYQCKRYETPLQPNHIVLELAKLCYYAHEGLFTVPAAYYFVAPQGAGNSLSQLLRNPVAMRDRLVHDWSAKCEGKITETKSVPLEGGLKDFVMAFDFSIVSYVPPMDLLEQHATTRWHAARFGGGLPTRENPVVPPLEDEDYESIYIKRLLEAYGDHVGEALDAGTLSAHQELHGHMLRSRERFFHAEALRNFSRDNLPPGQFEALQDEFYDGVIDNVEASTHADGYERVKTTTALAQKLDPTNNALREVLGLRDKAGICHQLADDDRLRWVRK